MHICPRCETTLSQQEVSEGYKDIKDLSVTAQFRVTSNNIHTRFALSGDVYVLAWTTTPWTLPGNVLIAVHADVSYALVKEGEAYFVVAKDLIMANFEGREFEVVAHVTGAELVGETYEPLFPYFAESKNSFRIVSADFVTTENGTGLVHLAPAFGTDDYEVFKQENVPFIQHVGMDGMFKKEVTDFAGMHVKPVQNHMATDVEIIKWLAHNGKLFSKKKYEHSYPHCWRCDTPLLNYATDSWFISVTQVKDRALELAKDINWSPEHIKEGRFGKWMEGARDWSVSRQRFWASVIPVWESEDGDQICVGSVAELEELSGHVVDDLHKHIVDKITFEKNGKLYTRVPDVLDTWFDSGSMPYAQVHYPFEHAQSFQEGFPAEFIAEGQDQTRAWFYYLHVIATAIMDKPAFKNVIVNGIVLAEDGKKMSKKLQNYPDPTVVLEQYGADALRYYMMNSPVVQAENLNFSEEGVREVYNKVVNTLWNVVEFYGMFSADVTEVQKDFTDSPHVLDRWILARLAQLVQESTSGLDAYKLNDATRPIMDFVLDLSQWYVRLSRSRLKGDDEQDKAYALATLQEVLLTLSKVMAPFTPFIAERVFQQVTGNKEQGTSVHLEEWPVAQEINEEVGVALDAMAYVRKVVELGHAIRKEHKLPVRQPLDSIKFSSVSNLTRGHVELVIQELNMKNADHDFSSIGEEYVTREENGTRVYIDITITDDLKKEGLLREVVRAVNNMRKEQGLTREDRVVLSYKTDDALLASVFTDFADELKASVLAGEVVVGEGESVEIDGRVIQLGLK
jgi:isoleucyl-tRNA synthetase